MTAVLFCLAVALGIHPADRTVWCVEMVWAVGLWAILFLTRRKFRFSTTAYLCFFAWMVLQIIGAHYTFEHVPVGWLMKPLGLARNPYDRIAHFTVGWFAFPLAELFYRKDWVRSAFIASFFAVMTTVAMAGIWELVEWIYAVAEGGAAGAAFLGSQGDVWDAQKDILCDTLGALCAVGVFLWRTRRDPEYWQRRSPDGVPVLGDNAPTAVWMASDSSRRAVKLFACLAVAGIAALAVSAIAVYSVSAGRVFDRSSVAKLPHCRAAVVLGCSNHLADGRLNLYFVHRISAAAELYRSGKVDCLIVSGDNHIKTYDEATDMKTSLAAAGVPADRVVCDYAGFRTLDSVVRAKKVFGLDSFIVVSQADHLRRAVFTARGFGCDAYGYAAPEVNVRFAVKTRIREQFAKVAAVLDVVLRRKPKFLGPREPLPA